MAKLNQDVWNNRQSSPSAVVDEADEAFLRPAAPAPTRKGGRAPKAAPELVPNYDPVADAEQFLRTRRRVAPKKTRWRRLLGSRLGQALLLIAVLALLAALGAAAWAVQSFLKHDPHFRIESSAQIEAAGNAELSRAELLNVFGSDIGRNVFFVPLRKREAALEDEPWVRHATVMRLLPNTLRVTIVERVPVAFVRLGRLIGLVDGDGVLLPMAPATLAARHYSFPVVVGLDPKATPEARAERMRLYQSFISALNAGGAHVSSQLSEVDLSDLEDVRAVVPAQGSDLLLHFGNSDFLERWRSYQEHLAEWRQQYPNLSAVDLRYDRQVVLKMADAAQMDEAMPAKPVAQPAAGAPRRAAAPGRAAPSHLAAAAQKPETHAWYTERRGPRHSVRWVPHYLPNAGRGGPSR